MLTILQQGINQVNVLQQVGSMPIYEYKCEKCGTVFETIVAVRSNDDIVCKNCGSRETRKLMSAGIKISQSGGNPGCQPRGGFS